jgi:flagellar basal body-associated protein FliL
MGTRQIADNKVRPSVPEIMVIDDVAGSAGASIVLAVAVCIALVLAMVVATVSAGTAHAAPGVTAVEGAANPSAIASPAPVRDGWRVADSGVGRDGIFHVMNPAPKPQKSIAVIVVMALFVAMLAATTMVWRALTRSFVPPLRQQDRAGRHRGS